jgi:hypothetical protein
MKKTATGKKKPVARVKPKETSIDEHRFPEQNGRAAHHDSTGDTNQLLDAMLAFRETYRFACRPAGLVFTERSPTRLTTCLP